MSKELQKTKVNDRIARIESRIAKLKTFKARVECILEDYKVEGFYVTMDWQVVGAQRDIEHVINSLSREIAKEQREINGIVTEWVLQNGILD